MGLILLVPSEDLVAGPRPVGRGGNVSVESSGSGGVLASKN